MFLNSLSDCTSVGDDSVEFDGEGKWEYFFLGKECDQFMVEIKATIFFLDVWVLLVGEIEGDNNNLGINGNTF